MHTETLAPKTKALFETLSENNKDLDRFYLSGGTALALHLGHRESEDLGFFTKTEFEPEQLKQQLSKISKLEDITLDKGTLNCYLNDVKLQFLYYPYSLLEEPTDFKNVKISSVSDIACTKLITISSRGSKKDFIDLFFILQTYSLQDLFDLLLQKYPKTDYNHLHILKSLVYFDDADIQPEPKMHKQVSWNQVKNFISLTVKNFSI